MDVLRVDHIWNLFILVDRYCVGKNIMTKKTFSVGPIWEDYDGEIHFDFECNAAYDRVCPHCHSFTLRINEHTGHSEKIFICPYVVELTNEGGHGSTGACLQCLVSLAKDIIKDGGEHGQ